MSDPGSETYFGWGKQCIGVEVPETGVDLYLLKDVPHGVVSARWYLAKTTGLWQRAYVYVPPTLTAMRAHDTRCSICSMARERMKRDGARKGT